MKREPKSRSGVRSTDPFKNLTDEQLVFIGAIAMLYNDVEEGIDDLCGDGLNLPIQEQQVLSRINGIEGKLELIKQCARHWGFDEHEMAFLGQSLGDGGFKQLKRWRDAVIHARVFDKDTAIARVNERRGGVSEVLLALPALKALYERLAYMRVELTALHKMLCIRVEVSRCGSDEQRRERLGQEFLTWWSRAQRHQSDRLSLSPMPEFPEDIPVFPRLQEILGQLARTSLEDR